MLWCRISRCQTWAERAGPYGGLPQHRRHGDAAAGPRWRSGPGTHGPASGLCTTNPSSTISPGRTWWWSWTSTLRRRGWRRWRAPPAPARRWRRWRWRKRGAVCSRPKGGAATLAVLREWDFGPRRSRALREQLADVQE